MTAPLARLTSALADRYRIDRELGQGGMATVFLAQDVRHDRKVAIKVLKPELAAVLGADRFVVEIKTTAALSHPHILPLFDSGTADGFLFYVMPYIQGETIREKLNRETQFGIEDAVRITREVADALDYAHRHGVIHRDIKPENILLHDGRAMVMDFGIALAVSAAAGGRMTETGLSLGTPHYMSPEQATADKDLTPRSDVYSLGTVLYEMLSGNPPHTGASAQQIIMKIVTDEARPVSDLRKSVPANVAAAVSKALEKLPADRFESARTFADALGDPRFTTVRIASHPTPAARPAARFVPWGIAAVLAVGLGGMALVRRSPTPAASHPMTFQIESVGDSLTPEGLAISADGRDIVMVGRFRGESRLYHRSIDATGVRAIPGTEGAGPVVAIRPDRSVLFWANRAIHEVQLDGGAPTRFARVGNFPAGMSWNDRAGLVLGMITFSRPTGLSRATRGDTGVTAITKVVGGMHHDPVILPDGEHAAFTNLGDGTAIGVASLKDGTWKPWPLSIRPARVIGWADGIMIYLANRRLAAVEWRGQQPVGEPMVVPDLPEGITDAAIAHDGTLVFASVADRSYQIVLVNPDGKATPLLRGETVTQFAPRFNETGTRVAFRSFLDGINDVRVLGLSDSVLQPVRVGDRTGIGAAWTRDGRVFVNLRARARQADSVARVISFIRARPADGSDSARVVFQSVDMIINAFDVSADGRLLALATLPAMAGNGTRALLLTRFDSGQPPIKLSTSSGDYVAPRFSPDGRWLAYASDESSRYEVYARSLTGSGVVQVSERGGGQPVWSVDGTRLYYRVGQAIVAADLTETASGGLTVRGHRRVFEGDFLGGESGPFATYDVTADGRIILARAVGEVATPIVVRTGWISDLKALMAARPEKR